MCLQPFKKKITPSQRGSLLIKKNYLNKNLNGLRYKKKGFSKSAGRNNRGVITVRHQGGGVKQIYRQIDLKRNDSKLSIVLNIEYDPNRSAFIAKMRRLDINSILLKNLYYYILAPRSLKVGDMISSYSVAALKIGNAIALQNVPIGTAIYNIPIKPLSIGVFARSAGTYAQLLKKINANLGLVRLPSGEQRFISLDCRVSIGVVSNIINKYKKIGKAGRSRWLNCRPTVRGVAMNPVDHPHGGGQGKTSGGRPSVSLWGWPTKGFVTRKRSKIQKMLVVPAEYKLKRK